MPLTCDEYAEPMMGRLKEHLRLSRECPQKHCLQTTSEVSLISIGHAHMQWQLAKCTRRRSMLYDL